MAGIGGVGACGLGVGGPPPQQIADESLDERLIARLTGSRGIDDSRGEPAVVGLRQVRGRRLRARAVGRKAGVRGNSRTQCGMAVAERSVIGGPSVPYITPLSSRPVSVERRARR